MTYELFQQGPAAYIPYLLLSLLVTLVAYGAFPVIFARVRKKVITKKKYTALCYAVNFLAVLFFIVLNGEPSSGFPYLLWTSIFSSKGVKELKSRGVLEGSQPFDYTKTETFKVTTEKVEIEPAEVSTTDSSPSVVDEQPSENENGLIEKEEAETAYYPKKKPLKKVRYCKFCGGEIDSEIKKCTSCGKQYFRMPKRFGVIVLAILCVILLGLNVLQYYEISAMRSDLETAGYKLNARDSLISSLNEKVSEYKDIAEFMDNHIVIVSDDGTRMYHKYGCEDLDLSYFWAYNTEAAESKGYYPCNKCMPWFL